MTKLIENELKPIDKNSSKKLNDDEIKEFLNELPQWNLVERTGMETLQRTYQFDNFAKALEFTNRVGEIAETAQHHPEIITEWGKVTVTWWTHSLGGLHHNDFVMALRTDGLIG